MPQVGYILEDGTVVRFELDAGAGFRAAGADEVVGRLREAAAPVVAGAKALLDAVRGVDPDDVEVKFGVKVSGTAHWLIAKAATEGNFEITLMWKADRATP
jgi:hypothetical protein